MWTVKYTFIGVNKHRKRGMYFYHELNLSNLTTRGLPSKSAPLNSSTIDSASLEEENSTTPKPFERVPCMETSAWRQVGKKSLRSCHLVEKGS